MRIVAGTFRGRVLVAPKGQSTRPTADRTRQALFNVLEHADWAPPLSGSRLIDVFAGSGALGLEAISRGAALALFVERDAGALGAIRANVAAMRLEGQTRLWQRDGRRIGARSDEAAFDFAFLDPPYGQGLGEPTLAALAAGGWLAPGALAVLERGVDDPAPVPPGFVCRAERVWGAARVTFLSQAL
ncbi:MAG TPA: 16S rRNA (guanine(966)-N(2))-methyltransferase RsmD [Caulobacteraceae bacterium]|jgi:16S rRNA (guanine966-N2)-methyltransferase